MVSCLELNMKSFRSVCKAQSLMVLEDHVPNYMHMMRRIQRCHFHSGANALKTNEVLYQPISLKCWTRNCSKLAS
jgi:hypothetical protein